MSNRAYQQRYAATADDSGAALTARKQFGGGKGNESGQRVIRGECTCPYCKNSFSVTYQDYGIEAKKTDLYCNRCGYEWVGRTGDPLKCPKCGSYAWNKAKCNCSCVVCGHTWMSRKPDRPSRCPSCKSSRWDESPVAVKKEIKPESTNEVIRKWVMERYETGRGCIDIATELGIPLFKVMDIVKEMMDSKVLPRICERDRLHS